MLDIDNTMRKKEEVLEHFGTPEVLPGEYISNNGVILICPRKSAGSSLKNFYLALNVSPNDLYNTGFKSVSGYVPFSNGVSRDSTPHSLRNFFQTNLKEKLLRRELKRKSILYNFVIVQRVLV